MIPDLKQAFFRCAVCGASREVMIDRGRIDEPTMCDACQASGLETTCVFFGLFVEGKGREGTKEGGRRRVVDRAHNDERHCH